MWVHPTVTASTMIADLNCGDKVRCHMLVVEKLEPPARSLAPRSKSPPCLRKRRGDKDGAPAPHQPPISR